MCESLGWRVVARSLFNQVGIHLSIDAPGIEREGNCESVIQEGPIELLQLPCLVRVEGGQPAVFGHLEGEEDDWVEVQLED